MRLNRGAAVYLNTHSSPSWACALSTLAFCVVAVLTGCSAPPATDAVPVLMMRDSNELRFTNDGEQALYDCTVTIDGGFSAILRELPAKDRKFLMRAQFAEAMPRDEFYSRTLRSVEMTCLVRDGYGGSERIAVRLR